LLEGGAGELADLGRQWDVTVGGGVGLAVVGEPVEHGDQSLTGGQAVLAGLPAASAATVRADGVT
jgi:hypothetical protein